MMDPMADNEHQPPAPAEGQPAGAAPGEQSVPPPAGPADLAAATPPAGTAVPYQPAPPAVPPAPAAMPAAPPPAVRAPTEITPDQVRQFQEFQQFQELMRQQADQGFPPPATPPPPGFLQPWGPPPKKPSAPVRFLKALGGKIVTAVLVVALLALGGLWAIDQFFGKDNEDQSADKTGGQGPQGNIVFPRNPYEAVRQIYDFTAQNRDGVKDTNLVCLKFTEDARAQFAENLGYTNCDEAVRALSEEVTDPNAYAESMPSATQAEITGTTIRISSCEDSYEGIQGGPPLGVFTLTQVEGSVGGQWIISGHQTETCDPSPSTSSPPTS